MPEPTKDAAPFWIVWCPTAPFPPTVKHPSVGSAETEAARLANRSPGVTFHVLKLTATVTSDSLRWERVPDEVPF